MAAEDVCGVHGRFVRDAVQAHACLLRTPATFVMIAGSAGGNHVRPNVESSLVPGYHVVDGQTGLPMPAVLTRIIIPPEDLAAGKLDTGARSSHLMFKSDD
jgi:hypothetical protein